jgi:hypothetical protein
MRHIKGCSPSAFSSSYSFFIISHLAKNRQTTSKSSNKHQLPASSFELSHTANQIIKQTSHHNHHHIISSNLFSINFSKTSLSPVISSKSHQNLKMGCGLSKPAQKPNYANTPTEHYPWLDPKKPRRHASRCNTSEVIHWIPYGDGNVEEMARWRAAAKEVRSRR